MTSKKVFLLLPDGVGLRNFAYTDFNKVGKAAGFEITYWNNTPFDLASLGFEAIDITKPKTHPLTETYKNARKHVELNLFIKRFEDRTYDSYRFPFSNKTFKQKVKTFLTKRLISKHTTESGHRILVKKITDFESSTFYFRQCLETLKKEQPDFVFCTSQRSILAIAPIQAAKKLGIPTATFIFSWDNLPKATMVVDTDYYVVWSTLMKEELLKYYPDITSDQIVITGTPQFENHFNARLKDSKEDFYNKHRLDLNKRYICYSGDDITTSPNDPHYLKDTAQAVRLLNQKGFNLGIVFRRCPVDFSTRFDTVLKEYQDVIMPIAPLWKKLGTIWDTVLPTQEDMTLQTNTIAHTEFVINLGSSMVFDYACYQKPCVYINYDIPNPSSTWSVQKIYKYIHFRSMPSRDAVVWFNDVTEIEIKIRNILENKLSTTVNANAWFKTINQFPPEKASERIWDFIKNATA
ncbi:UDP-glycosyltransferase [Subsaximicrobium wynnwilliamsii]|uniref:UDP-glycosyltransferase n=1 Tax=Subsaximicrobium wynnwilliamsii TaxID=291179 RepID=A0A5C6ZFL4_9FLAO|nr:UDP-glycosyltransferase [Subsaximicrobium wynnwilliamsii]TXD81720.1 UDP-glycosyltransferase [Subsaximicrobium wynnwilliamsii]TXD87475.1 UDP-glycosyltransferase [Subsaximicrobium wynnwilliamsii]TXE01163.1 UDP-glycosyltransferase [Subsaximicrobium wynnwilliamsii]